MINRGRKEEIKAIFIAMLIVSIFVITIGNADVYVYAQDDETVEELSIEKQCELFTKNENLQVDSDHTIIEYEAYIDEHFEIGARSAKV